MGKVLAQIKAYRSPDLADLRQDKGFVRDLVVDLAVLVVMCVLLLTAIILIFGGALKSDTEQE